MKHYMTSMSLTATLALTGLFFGFSLAQTDDHLIVEAGVLGRIRGLNGVATENGTTRPYIQFRSIPYATVNQRFSPSVLNEQDLSGNGTTFNATITGPSCYQPFLPEQILSEDCLLLNVYTQRKYTNDSDLRPVIFFIHGGAFTVGQGGSFSGLRMMNRDVVLVTFNYRLGLLGFFSLQTETVPGNAGMYDVVNALQWTNNYIRYFGGDPTKITIAGQSAGGVSVTALMVSPMAQGLFHGAIAASGSSLNAWGTATDPMQGALDVSTRLGCYDGTSAPNLSVISTCMMQVSNASRFVDALMNYQIEERQAGRLGFAVVSPVVQNFNMTHPKFLPEHPRAVFMRGDQADVPLMMSTTKHDGSYVLGVFYNRYLLDNGLENNATFLRYQLVPKILESLGVEDRPSGIHESIAQTYLGDAKNSGNFQSMYPGLMDIFSVFFFKGDVYETALLHSRKVENTFWSSFEFYGTVSFWGQLFPGNGTVPPFPGGITHTDDLLYIFALTFLPFTPEEAAVSSRMLSYWADFATVGRPSQNWEPLGLEENYMIIGVDSVKGTSFKESWPGPGYEAEPPNQVTTPDMETTPEMETTSSDIETTTSPDIETTPPATTFSPSESTGPGDIESTTAPGLGSLHFLTPSLLILPLIYSINKTLFVQ